MDFAKIGTIFISTKFFLFFSYNNIIKVGFHPPYYIYALAAV